MKTILFAIRRRLKSLVFFTFLFSLYSSPVRAQEAFYIYQNDGHFNGFFYDEVESIEYSCVDTLGRVFAFPVSQEIVTADSTYRIMLTAIDSVSFVQPEIRFNPRLKNLVTDSLMRYVAAVDSLKLTFTADMPADQRPTVGDVIVGFDGDLCGEGFGGKVRAIEDADGQLVVLCDSLECLDDLFDQFITVEQYVKESEAHQMRHRIAGMNRSRHNANSEFSIDSYPVSQSWDLHIPFRWNTNEGDVTASVNFHLGIGIKATGVYDIRPSLLRFYLKTELSEVFEHSGTIDFDGKLWGPPATQPFAGIFNKIAGKLGFPAVCPVFQVNVMPETMLRAEAHFHAKVGYGIQATRLTETLEFSDFEFKKPVVHVKGNRDGYDFDDPSFILQAELNGFAQAGIYVPIELGTNQVVRKYFKATCGVYFYIGPKISGNLTLDAWAMRRPGWYNLLKESKIDFSLCSVDWEAKASLESMDLFRFATGGKKKYDITLLDGSFLAVGNKSIWLVPEYENLAATHKAGSSTTVTATVRPKRDVLFDSHIGLGIYDMNDKLVQKWYDESRYYSWLLPYGTAPVTHDFTIEKSGRYRLRPLSRLKRLSSLDIPYVPDDEVEFTIDNSPLTATPTPLVANKIGGMRQLTIDCNLHEYQLSCDADWLTFNTESYGAKTRGISFAPLPSGEIERAATLVIVGYNEDRTFSKSVEVPVVQNIIGSNEPALSTDPTHLEFEAKSEQKAVALLTNCSDASVQKCDPWIHASIAGGKVNVSVDVNPSLDERRGSVTLAGSKDGTAATCVIEVLQEGVLSLSTHRMEYAPEGGTKDAILKSSGFPVTIECMDDWYTATLDGQHLAVVADENWTVGTREGEVVLKVNVAGTEVSTSITVVQDAWIVCEPSELKNVGAWGTIEDVIIKSTKLKNLSIDAVCDWVGIGMTDSDTRLTISVSENEGGAREGAATISGYKGSTKYTLRFPVSQKAGGDLELPFNMIKPETQVGPAGGSGSVYYQGSCAGVKITANRSWIKNLRFKEDGYEDMTYGWLQFDADPNPDEWNDREATILLTKQMSKTEIFNQEVKVTQIALANAEPRIWSLNDSRYVDYDPVERDTVELGYVYVDELRVTDESSWLSAYFHDKDKLVIDADINRADTMRYGHVVVTGTNRYGRRAECTISVAQHEYNGRNAWHMLEGVCVGVESAEPDARWNGYSNRPYTTGVVGRGYAGGNFEVVNSVRPDYTVGVDVNYTDDNGGRTTASFNVTIQPCDTSVTRRGWQEVINGSFRYEMEREGYSESMSLQVHNMPNRGLGLPYPNHEGWFDQTAWSGDGGWDIVENGHGENGYITSFKWVVKRTVIDSETHEAVDITSDYTSRSKICVYLFDPRSTSRTDRFPVGHPERTTK